MILGSEITIFLVVIVGKKILVLGESHYCKDLSNGKCSACKRDNMRDDCFSQTVDVISGYIENYTGERYEQTFLCFERAVLGKKLSLDERKEFWHSVVFYNYIQFDQSGPRKNLIPETSNTSEEAFKEILEKYKPDCHNRLGVSFVFFATALGR